MSTLSHPTSSSKLSGRNLVLCFDGTGNSFDDKSTNVLKLYSILQRDSDSQLTYYQPGLGTYVSAGFWTKTAQRGAALLDKACATYLEHHVCGGYKFLQENYRHGDRIYLFGFSRGAYTARALAGMLCKVGLLSKDNVEQVSFAYNLYISHSNMPECRKFRRAFSRIVEIEFLGCWDTVSSVGYLYGVTLPYTRSNKMVKVFRHALALDERRAKFKANHWQDPELKDKAIVDDYSYGNPISNAWRWVSNKVFGKTKPTEEQQKRMEAEVEEYKNRPNTNVLEVWFAGCHADVGGGSTDNTDRASLANPPLRWMLSELISHCPQVQLNLNNFALVTLGLSDATEVINFYDFGFDRSSTLDDRAQKSLQKVKNLYKGQPLKPSSIAQAVMQSQQLIDVGNEATDRLAPILNCQTQREVFDILTPLHDQLRNWKWWPLELFPLEKFYTRDDKDDKGQDVKILRRWWRVNFFRGRVIPHKTKYYFHYTVKKRLDCALGYQHRATLEGGNDSDIEYVYDAPFGPTSKQPKHDPTGPCSLHQPVPKEPIA